MTPQTLLFVHATPSALGGSEVAAARAAAELRRRGHRVLLLHGEAAPLADRDAYDGGFSAPVLFERPAPGTAAARRRVREELRVWTRAQGVDLVHAHLWGTWVLLAELARIAPLVVSAHLPVCPNGARYRFTRELPCDRPTGLGCLTWGHRTQGCGHTADLQPFGAAAMTVALAETKAELRAMSRAAAVIAPSRWQRDRLVADGVPAERVHVAGGPVVVPDADGVPEPLSPTCPSVVVACRLVRFKGVHHLIDASAASRVAHELHVIGDGAARQELEAQAARLGIADRVAFHGRLSPTEVAQFVRRADVVAAPSLWPETFGMAGAEASALGRPVMAYSHGGTMEWLSQADGDVAVDVTDPAALARALEALVARRGAKRIRRRPFASLATHVDAIERAYRDGVSARAGA